MDNTILILVVIGAFASFGILADDVVALNAEELEKIEIDNTCIEIATFLQATNDLVEKEKLAQTDAYLLLDLGQNIKDTIGCT